MTDNDIICAMLRYSKTNILKVDGELISVGDILDLINRKNAEIERLEANLKEALAETEALKQINLHCKSETLKELSERLKDIPRKHLLLRPDSYYKQYVRVTDINKLVKEMEGEG